MKVKLFKNKRNPNKFIEVKHCKDRHYMWRQTMRWDNGVVNYSGGTKAFRRQGIGTISEVIDDYEAVV